MKANKYIQPIVEIMALEAAYTICAESSSEIFSITYPGTEIGADEGR